MKWTYKNHHYYLDLKMALGILGLLVIAPLLVAWGNNINVYFSWWSLIGFSFVVYLIYHNCLHVRE